MPKDDKKQQAEDRIKFLADRMAILMVDLICREVDYGEFCYEEFYTSVSADVMRESKHYEVALDLVRSMIRKHDVEMAANRHVTPSSAG